MIRKYRPEDESAVLRVWLDAARVAHAFWPPERFAREREAVADEFLPRAETWVFEREGAVVGFISLLGFEVGGLFVSPSHHRQGIGRALMDQACRSRDHLELDVFEANALGRAFYDRYGFVVVAQGIDETGQHVLRLRFPPSTGPQSGKDDAPAAS